jgi:hypothetical protein
MTATRPPDALDLYERLALANNVLTVASGRILAADTMGREPDASALREARDAAARITRALDEYEKTKEAV